MSLIMDMKKTKTGDVIPGKCANCRQEVFESLATLDDTYNVWLGRCPHCRALNFLALEGLRGYGSGGMELVLPTEEEKESNDLPADCPTSGKANASANIHGSNLGELCHQIGVTK